MVFNDIEYYEQIGIKTDKNNRRYEIPLKNDGQIVVYYPLEGVQIIACDIRCKVNDDVKRLIVNDFSRGRFIRTTVCSAGSCKFKKDSLTAVLVPNEGAAEYRTDDYPLLEIPDFFYGLMTVLYLDKVPKEGSLYSIFADRIKNIGFSEVNSDSLFYFRQSKSTRRELEKIMNMCFSGADQAMILIKAAELGLRYSDDIKNSTSGYRRFASKSQIDIAEEIKNCLTKYYDRPWTTKYFAEKFKISSTTVNKYFMGVYGYEIKEYQIKVRMERAAKMLCETNYSVGEIAQWVGYSTHAKFGAMFKEKYGIPPLEYRRRYRVAHSDKSYLKPEYLY